MKIIHTADWHLGQTFHDYDRKEEHKDFLDWLRTQIQLNGIDLLLIAGDVFDNPNPSAESQKMLYHFLRKVNEDNNDLQIIIIAGNHDSAARLEAPNPLLEDMNISVRGLVKKSMDGEIDWEHLVIPLKNGGNCLAVPFLRQGDYHLSNNYQETISKVYETLMSKININDKPIIAMGHLQAQGAQITENDRSERTIIGGLDGVSSNVFSDEIDYTALGHLHKAQKVGKRENVRYSGSPLPMSFAEINYEHGVTLIDINDNVDIAPLRFESPAKLISVPSEPEPLDKVIDYLMKLPDGDGVLYTTPYLEVKVLITEPEPSMNQQIKEALNGKNVRLARISSFYEKKDILSTSICYEEVKNMNPMDIACDLFKREYGGDELPKAMKELLEKLIHEINL